MNEKLYFLLRAIIKLALNKKNINVTQIFN